MPEQYLNSSSLPKVIGTGSFYPQLITNEALLALVDVRKPDGSLLPPDWLERHFGIRSRAFDFDMVARRKRTPEEGGWSDSGMAIAASRKALAQAQVDPREITALIHLSATPDYSIFQNHVELMVRDLELSPTTQCIHLNLGCPGLATAFPLVHGELLRTRGTVLLTASQCTSGVAHNQEILNRYRNASDPWTWLGTTVFSDAAAAAVFKLSAPGQARGIVHAHAEIVPNVYPLFKKYGGSKHPTLIGNLAEDVIRMDAAWVAGHFVPSMRALYDRLIHDWPEKIQPIVARPFDPDIVKLWFFHQANLRKIEEAVEALGLPKARVPTHIEWLGNSSGPSTLILLDDALKSGALRPGDLCVFFWIGGGTGAQRGYSVMVV